MGAGDCFRKTIRGNYPVQKRGKCWTIGKLHSQAHCKLPAPLPPVGRAGKLSVARAGKPFPPRAGKISPKSFRKVSSGFPVVTETLKNPGFFEVGGCGERARGKRLRPRAGRGPATGHMLWNKQGGRGPAADEDVSPSVAASAASTSSAARIATRRADCS